MLTATPHGPAAPSEEIVVPRYLLCFSMPPAIAAIVLSILDPALGLTLLGVGSVIGLVLRVVVRNEAFRRPSPPERNRGSASSHATHAFSSDIGKDQAQCLSSHSPLR